MNDNVSAKVAKCTVAETLLLVGGLCVLITILLLPPELKGSFFLNSLQYVARTLRGEAPNSDVATDIVGWRAIASGRPAYPVLADGLREMGIKWNVRHVSTHPPTAFLLVAPVAALPWAQASLVWAWLMIGALCLSFVLLGISFKGALGLTLLALLWPPVGASLGQLTLVWLLGVAIGYSCLRRYPIGCGVGIGLASLTKLVPGAFVLLFLKQPHRKAWLGFGLVWSLALTVLAVAAPTCLEEYFRVNQSNAAVTMQRGDNSGLLVAVWRQVGWAGGVGVVAFLAALVWRYREDFRRQGEGLSSERLWILFSYLTVALLPIAWGYSRAPLIPALVFMARSRSWAAIILTMAAVAIPLFTPVWGRASVWPLLGVDLLVGLGLWVVRPQSGINQESPCAVG